MNIDMLKVDKEGIILAKTELAWEHEGVLNPAVIMAGDHIHLFYRAVARGNYSTIGHCVLEGPLKVMSRNPKPVIFPQFDYESQGVEDPRIVQIDGLYHLSYTAYDGVNARGAVAISTDLVHFEKIGVITPELSFEEFQHLAECKGAVNEKYLRFNQRELVKVKHGKKVFVWDKNVIFFPRRIRGKLHFLHRVRPDIQVVAVDELAQLTRDFWQKYFLQLEDHIVLEPRHAHEVSYVGGGCPPIETAHGWLLIYHGVHDTVSGYVYTACAALLDLEAPQNEIARLPYPLFFPEMPWELRGEVNNVCFPTGTVVLGDRLYIYYGAADERIACASMSLPDLLAELLLNKTVYE